jgi:asparagine synthase (glutamine-hydrolysing)
LCGIFGILRPRRLHDGDEGLLRRLAAAQVHRGPDGEGFFTAPGVALGMRRLAIIDLNGGWQPLYNEDRSIALVANGEIYNFVELRRDLEARGHRFNTGSDCETIAHLYEEYGADCVRHLRGMFAFALYDAKRRKVLVARDRIGEKPMHLVETDDGIVFCSEAGSLVKAGAVPFEPDWAAIKLYLYYSFVPEPLSVVRGVRKLPAGCLLEIDLDPWKVEERRWWSMLAAPPIDRDPVVAVREELEAIGELIIRSDVPVGVALSGGLDSSAIACLAAKRYAGKIEAFTVGYPGSPWQDERGMARELATHLGIPMHEIEISTSDVVGLFPTVCARRDDPIADPSGPSYLAVMQAARAANVPVMLLGQGGDELFWGYGWVQNAVAQSRRKLAALEGRARFLDYLSMRRPPVSYVAGLRWLSDLGGLRSSIERYRSDRASDPNRLVFYDLASHYVLAEHTLGSTVTNRFLEATAATNPASIFTGKEFWTRPDLSITKLICETYLLCNGINQGDRLSMATSVEGRMPLVDYRLIETVIGLRKVHRDDQLPSKSWFRGAVKGVVPDFVLARQKRGFTPPWRDWIRAIMDRFGDHLSDGYLVQQGILDQAATSRLRKGITRVSTPMPLALEFLVLEEWCRSMKP